MILFSKMRKEVRFIMRAPFKILKKVNLLLIKWQLILILKLILAINSLKKIIKYLNRINKSRKFCSFKKIKKLMTQNK